MSAKLAQWLFTFSDVLKARELRTKHSPAHRTSPFCSVGGPFIVKWNIWKWSFKLFLAVKHLRDKSFVMETWVLCCSASTCVDQAMLRVERRFGHPLNSFYGARIVICHQTGNSEDDRTHWNEKKRQRSSRKNPNEIWTARREQINHFVRLFNAWPCEDITAKWSHTFLLISCVQQNTEVKMF